MGSTLSTGLVVRTLDVCTIKTRRCGGDLTTPPLLPFPKGLLGKVGLRSVHDSLRSGPVCKRRVHGREDPKGRGYVEPTRPFLLRPSDPSLLSREGGIGGLVCLVGETR